MTELNTETPKEETEGTVETADVKPTATPKPPRNAKKAPKETETGETQIVLANLTATQNSNTKEPEIVNLGDGITAINR